MIRTAVILLISLCSVSFAQQSDVASQATGSTALGYLLGPGDQIQVQVLDVEDVSNKPLRIDPSGNIDLGLIGLVQAGGKTTDQLRADVISRLRKYIKEPMVTVSVIEFHSRSVSVLGAVNNPGSRQVEGPRTVLDMISVAGGLRPDAGSTITVMRPKASGPLPQKGSRTLLGSGSSVATFDVYSLMSAKDPEENIQVLPNDTIVVAEAEQIAVWGEVKKPGSFTLRPHQPMTVMQALALAEGPQKTAAEKRAYIVRTEGQGLLSKQIATDVSAIMSGKKPDVPMQARDILVIPNNATRNATLRAVETAVQIGTGILIFHR